MLGESCGLEVLEMVLTKDINPDKTNEVTTLGSTNDASSSGVFTELVKMELAQSVQLLDPERNNPHSLVQVGSRLVITPCL